MNSAVPKWSKWWLLGIIILMFSVIYFAPSGFCAPASISGQRQLMALRPAELEKHLPVRIQGTVLCFDKEWNQLFISTAEGVQYVPASVLRADFKPGQVIEIMGRTCTEPKSFPLTNISFSLKGVVPLPSAKQVKNFGTQTEWAEFVASVRTADTSRGRLTFKVGKAGNECTVFVMGPIVTKDCKRLVQSTVRVKGITLPAEKSFGPKAMVPSMNFIQVIANPEYPVASLPVVSIDTLLNRDLGDWTNQPVHLNGVVLASTPGEFVILRDPTGVIRANTEQGTKLSPGDRLDLWGYLDSSRGEPVIDDAFFELTTPIVATSLSPSAQPASSTMVVSNIAQLRSLPNREVARGLNISFQGVVLYSDPEWNTAFIHDGTSSIFAEVRQTNIMVGQWVQVTGRATSGNFCPVILPARFKVLGKAQLPRPRAADMGDVPDGTLDAQWVEFQGVVRHATAEWDHLHLALSSRQGKFNVVIPQFPSNTPPAGLIDSRVSVVGICGSDLNARKQLAGVTIYTPSLDNLRILEPAPAEPFSIPRTPIAAVSTFDPERIAGRRIKLAGTVILNIPGYNLIIQDSSAGIRLDTALSQTPQLAPGDDVEVLGFPALGDFSPHLEEPIIRVRGRRALPIPAFVSAEQILLYPTNDAAVVCLDGELLQRIPHSVQPKLVLQAGSTIFTANLVAGYFPESVLNWRPGSRLRLTGICSIQGSETHNPQSFRLLLSDPGHVILLSAPPAWTTRDLVLTGATVAGLGLFALAWIAMLRREVRARTDALKASKADLQRQLNYTRALSDLGRRLNAASTPKEAAQIIVDVADHLIGWDSCVWDFYSEQTRTLTPVLNIDIVDGRRTDCQVAISLPLSGLARQAIESGAQMLLRRPEDLQHVDTMRFGDTGRPSASILYVPIRNVGHVIGVLSIQSYRLNAYNEEHLQTLQALADHCGGALDRIEAHQKLLEVSRQAGMAEVATGVLHNVGNVLNSVNVSVALLLERAKDSRSERLARISEFFSQHSNDLAEFLTRDPKGQKIPGYLQTLADVMAQQERTTKQELEALAKNVEHIKEIVAMQQSYARMAGAIETVTAAELVEDSLRLNAGSLARHEVQVTRVYPQESVTLQTDRHKVLQILINLIRNAKYACDESGSVEKELTVLVEKGTNSAFIKVRDNGAGIAPENLNRIFTLGFSTRKAGHGFGLHSGALAAKELGGSLSVASEGPGKGATFTLELPMQHSSCAIASDAILLDRSYSTAQEPEYDHQPVPY